MLSVHVVQYEPIAQKKLMSFLDGEGQEINFPSHIVANA